MRQPKIARLASSLIRTTSAAAICVMMAGTAMASTLDDADAEDERRTIVVTGTQLKSEASVSRNALDKDEQARSLQIYDEEVIERVNPATLGDIVTLSANVTFDGTNDGRESGFVIRGFGAAPVLRDGFRVTTFGGVADPELFNLESVEVLKGPDSILYGESSPGGLINLRTKRPLDENRTLLQVEVGSNPSISPRFDVNRVAGDVAFRVVGLYEYDDNWRAYDTANRKYSLVPTFRWDSGAGTVVTVLGEVVLEDIAADFGTAVDSNGRLTAPIKQVNNHPTDTFERDFYSVGIDFEQGLTQGLTAEARVRYFDATYDYGNILLPVAYDEVNNIYTRSAADQDNSNKEWAAQFNLFGDFDVGSLRNRFTLGADYRNSDTLGSTLFDPVTPYLLDWANPDYSQLPPPSNTIPDFGTFGTETDRYGIFFQNHLNITPQLLISTGVRYDKVKEKGGGSVDNTSFQIGGRYEFSEQLSVFASFSEAFEPTTTTFDVNGDLLPPTTGQGWEAGIKGRLFDGRLSYTAAYFDIEKDNVPLPDPNNPLFSVASGVQKAHGAEFDISGQVTDAWSIILSAGFTDTEDENGFEFLSAGDFTSALFTTYQIDDNWGVSLGYEYVGERAFIPDPDGDGSDADAINIPDHFILNAAVNYEKGPFRAQLNVTNLTDERYVDAASFGFQARGNYPGAPLQAMLTLTYDLR